MMEEQLRLESSEQIRIRRKRLERNENRIAELNRLFIRIYEDNACGRLSDERFDMLSLTYETEQKAGKPSHILLRALSNSSIRASCWRIFSIVLKNSAFGSTGSTPFLFMRG